MSKEKLKERSEAIRELATSFCAQHLDEDYFELVEYVILKLSRKRPSPLLRGKLEIWAAGAVHAIGQVNFLYDKSFEPYISFTDLNKYFGTKSSSVGNKAADIRKMFKMDRYSNFEFMTKGIKENHVLYNSVMVNGLIVPLSSIPEEYQIMVREAREKGEDLQFWTE
ncbi:MAG: DUF6398 domain-containing protein [Bacteroidota bacterium]